jgi:transposase-like protein
MAKRVRLSKAEREAFWRRQINDWAQGGQTIAAFCREHGLTESAFHLWRRELGLKTRRRQSGRNKSHSSAPRLVPITVAAMPTSALTLEVNGATLHIESGVDEVLLHTVLNALKLR